MTDREQLVREAEELAQKLTGSITWSPQGARRLEIAALIRRLLSLLPKEVKGKDVCAFLEKAAVVHFESKKDRNEFISAYKAMIETRPRD